MEHRWSIIIIIVKMNYNHVWVFFITIIYSGGGFYYDCRVYFNFAVSFPY